MGNSSIMGKLNQNLKRIFITPETHWDREWYLPFEGYRQKLVLLFDRLLKIIRENPNYKNFTFDGQTVVVQDYLEVRPEKEQELAEAIKSGKITVGPMYILPDEYLVSGEALIRNFMLGHKIANKYGTPMNAAYIPDPFGHIAQLPQIIDGFGLPSVLFARGFGNEYVDNKLDMEFIWEAPADAAEIIGIHLVDGYGSVAGLSDIQNTEGIYEIALGTIERKVKLLAEHSLTGNIILNNGTDHHFAQPIIPEIVKQWNQKFADRYAPLDQTDFGTYSKSLLANIPQMKHYQGELHGGKYQYLLSGILSTRMWIKQENWRTQTLLERYTEPFAFISRFLTNQKYEAPTGLIWYAWQTLLRNHPHDSICGCSVDEVHDIDMKQRFFQAFELGEETLKESLYQLQAEVSFEENQGERFAIMVTNPSPWERSDNVELNLYTNSNIPFNLVDEGVRILDWQEKEMQCDIKTGTSLERYNLMQNTIYSITFHAEKVPAFGYKTFYLYPAEKPEISSSIELRIEENNNLIENKYYRVKINPNGTFNLFDKELEKEFKNIGILEDGGDWGDEYDFSGPKADQTDHLITSEACPAVISTELSRTNVKATIQLDLDIPLGLDEGHARRERLKDTIKTQFRIQLSLPLEQKLLDIVVEWDNQSKDHRVRYLFPTEIQTDMVSADGHFCVLSRSIKPPVNQEGWEQNWVPTHHQNRFISLFDEKNDYNISIFNKGLPEYEIIQKPNGCVAAVTLLRSVGWLSRGDFATRKANAGPSLPTPGAQCIGVQSMALALTTNNDNWLESNVSRKAEEYTTPLRAVSYHGLKDPHRYPHGIAMNFDNSLKNNFYPHNPHLKSELGFCEINNPNILITTLKKAESDEDLILRVLNIANTIQTTEVTFPTSILNAQFVNYNEELPQSSIASKSPRVSTQKDKIHIELPANRLITLKISLEKI